MQATPTSETAMFYFQTNKLGFTPEFLGRVRLVAAVASLAGVRSLPLSATVPHQISTSHTIHAYDMAGTCQNSASSARISSHNHD